MIYLSPFSVCVSTSFYVIIIYEFVVILKEEFNIIQKVLVGNNYCRLCNDEAAIESVN